MDAQRRHALGRLDRLGMEALRRPVLPSGRSCLGLVQHLALDVERFWFRAVITGGPAVIEALDDIDDAWQVAPDAPHTEVLDRYRTEVDLANAATAVDTPQAWWPHHLFGEPHLHTVRDVLLHAITETARHTGHLDAARGLVDGHRWMVLT
ncbi:DUF664 domain-containing protein [Streptomyces sp. NPDC005356]|uniref:mycothiol transferase n=1 Tax=Streptomyces sp. NPDC005356 TaxID=3157167 RepID=UPI0033B0D7DF